MGRGRELVQALSTHQKSSWGKYCKPGCHVFFPRLFLFLSESDTRYLSLTSSRWEISRKQIDLHTILGSGAFGEVWKAVAYGLKGYPGETTVAVKKLKRKSLLITILLMKENCASASFLTIRSTKSRWFCTILWNHFVLFLFVCWCFLFLFWCRPNLKRTKVVNVWLETKWRSKTK